jgi:ribonuclease Z
VLEALPGLKRDWLPFPLHYVEVREGFTHEVVYEDAVCTVEARPLAHRVFAMGFRYEERPRPGRVDASRARELGVEPRQIGELVRGDSITTPAGRTVRPEEVVGPARRGACVAYCLDTMPCEGAARLAADVDLLIHDATFADDQRERAEETAHSTARQAAEVARDAGARRLLLTHFSARYDDLSPLLAEAREVFAESHLAEELGVINVGG